MVITIIVCYAFLTNVAKLKKKYSRIGILKENRNRSKNRFGFTDSKKAD